MWYTAAVFAHLMTHIRLIILSLAQELMMVRICDKGVFKHMHYITDYVINSTMQTLLVK